MMAEAKREENVCGATLIKSYGTYLYHKEAKYCNDKELTEYSQTKN